MNKDQLKGKVDEAIGRVERQAGEWSGDEKTQARGAARQARGKLQKVAGKVKNAVKPKRKDAA